MFVPIPPIVVKTSDTGSNGSNGSNFNEDGIAYTLDTTNGQAITTSIAFTQNQMDEIRDLEDLAGCLAAETGMKQQTYLAYGIDEECNAREEQFGALLRGGEGGTHQSVVQIIGLDSEFNSREELAGPLTTDTSGDKGMVAGVLFPQLSSSSTPSVDDELNCNDELMGTLKAQRHQAFIQRQHSFVRRLTPKEASRLQGFPDNWAMIPWKGKPADQSPDGPQYKCYGNSMAVPVIRWLGERIQMVHNLIQEGKI